MELKPGYKQTEVGAIPDDWEVRPLKALAEKIMVGIASAATHAYRERGIVLFRNQNIKPDYLDDSDILHIRMDYEVAFKNKRLKAGDLLTARTGYPGTTCVVPPHYENAQSFTTLITRPNKRKIDSNYLCRFINSKSGQIYFEQNQIGGGQKNVNASSLKLLPVAFPPNKAEQEAIAGALSDTDALIKSLEQLTAKKRDIKQAGMQELLTGNKRLPGFEGKWVTKKMGDLGVFHKGSGIKKDEAQSGDLPCVRYGEIYTAYNNCIREFRSWISKEIADRAVRIRQGDILFAGSGETKEEIGKCVALVEDVEAYAGGDIVILRTTEGNPSFLGYYLNTAPICKQKASMGQGDAVVHISSSALANIEITVPESTEEQAAIGEILTDIDAEICALEAKVTKVRQIKQGMIDSLLTGRIRLT